MSPRTKKVMLILASIIAVIALIWTLISVLSDDDTVDPPTDAGDQPVPSAMRRPDGSIRSSGQVPSSSREDTSDDSTTRSSPVPRTGTSASPSTKSSTPPAGFGASIIRGKISLTVDTPVPLSDESGNVKMCFPVTVRNSGEESFFSYMSDWSATYPDGSGLDLYSPPLGYDNPTVTVYNNEFHTGYLCAVNGPRSFPHGRYVVSLDYKSESSSRMKWAGTW